MKRQKLLITDKYIRLVYSERQGCFHFDNIEHPFIVSGGYRIVSDKIKLSLAMEFTSIVHRKFRVKDASFETVINLFNNFINENNLQNKS
jgi:hypothetical protein